MRLTRLAAGVLLSLLVLAGCRTPERLRFAADTRINGKPARFDYDTGAGATVLLTRSAKHLGLKYVNPPSSMKPPAGKVTIGHTERCRFSVDGETYSIRLKTVRLPWPMSWLFDVDGCIGWPDLSDDYIAIDAEAGAIRGLDRLPADTNGWLQLPIYRRPGVLALETPRPDGKTGVWEVDTGNDEGVSLSPVRWKEWRATHPHAHWKLSFGGMPGSGMRFGRTFKANDLVVGPLNWTNVPVRKANRTEMGIVSSGDVFEGSIGVTALQQFNLILDRKDGMAYLRRRPVVAATNSSPRRDDRPGQGSAGKSTVHLGFREQEYFDLASDAYEAGHFDQAITNISRLLEQHSNDWQALEFRGTACYMAQRWEEAVKDFRRLGEVNEGMASYAQFYVWVIRARTGHEEAATRDLAVFIGPSRNLRGDRWEGKLAAFLLGRLSEADLLRSASHEPGDKLAQVCEAWFYAGIKRRLAGDTTTARKYFRKCRATERRDEDEYHFAAAELRTLK